jgi:hypothetical protein
MKTRSTFNRTFNSLWKTLLEATELLPLDLIVELRDNLTRVIDEKTKSTVPEQTILYNFDANGSPVGEE